MIIGTPEIRTLRFLVVIHD